MAKLVNRAKMTTATTGTGTITLGSAVDGYQTFADAGVADTDVVRYVIEDGSDWEIGTGTYTSTGTTLTRTVLESSNADAAINLSSSAAVFVGTTAEDLAVLDGLTATTAEINTLDGFTGTVADLNYAKDLRATGVTTAEFDRLDGLTATAAELNKLDGATVTTAELNYNDISTLGTSQASKVVTADSNGNVKLQEELQVTAYIETVVALSGTSVTVDCDEANSFTLNTSGNTTFTFSYAGVNLTTNDSYGFTLRVTAGGTHTLSWPASVDWPGGTAPDAPASGETDVFVFYTVDGGTNWYGFQAGDALA